MAKKSRRARRRGAKRTASKPQTPSEPVGGAQGALVEASGLSRATTASLTEQYGYVYDDLKRIAILAGAMFAILIALAFVVG